MNNKALKIVFVLFISICFGNIVSAEKYLISSLNDFNRVQEKITSGDSIIWKEGHYLNLNLNLEADDIVFLAEKPGTVIFSGSSSLIVIGNGNTISGFQFVGGKIEDDVVDVFGSKNTISQINIQKYDAHYYLHIRPNCMYNVISYCNFESKAETQESSVVQVEATESLPGYHKIMWCSFKNHTAPPGVGGDYGIEALRIGYSFQADFISRTIVEYCYFEKCNGDGEIVSNKARENIFRYNTFENNGDSHFTLRHAKDNVVYGNFFLNGAGIRIKEGQNQMVYNNYFQTGDKFAIMLVNYKADPLENIIIANNTFAGSGTIKLGGKGDFKPVNVALVNNLFLNPGEKIISDPSGNEYFAGNIINNSKEELPKGFNRADINSNENKYGLMQPTKIGKLSQFYSSDFSELLDIPQLDDDPFIQLDIMKQNRTNSKKSVAGCFIPNKKMTINTYATSQNTGPVYLY